MHALDVFKLACVRARKQLGTLQKQAGSLVGAPMRHDTPWGGLLMYHQALTPALHVRVSLSKTYSLGFRLSIRTQAATGDARWRFTTAEGMYTGACTLQ